MRNRRILSWSAGMRDMRGERVQRAAIREERLRVTSALKGKASAMTSWLGLSGRRYVVGVQTLSAEIADMTDAVVIAVERTGDGTARVVDVAAPNAATSRRARLRWLALMRTRGATEMHVHLLAEDERERDAVLRDLSAG